MQEEGPDAYLKQDRVYKVQILWVRGLSGVTLQLFYTFLVRILDSPGKMKHTQI